MKATGEFTVTQWNEARAEGFGASVNVSRVSVRYQADGAINGKFTVEYLMYYTRTDDANPHGAEASYSGYMEFIGSIDGKSGSFALEERGTYGASGPSSRLSIIPDSGTGDLSSIGGTGMYNADDGKMVMELDYTL